jgi:hypothetical protein
MPKSNEAKLQKECDDFNAKYPLGSPVMLKEDFVDEPTSTSVTSRAFIMCGSAVAFFAGISGSYDISSVV